MAITNSLNSGIANTTPSTIQKKTAGLVSPRPTWQQQLQDVQSTYFANNPLTPRTPIAPQIQATIPPSVPVASQQPQNPTYTPPQTNQSVRGVLNYPGYVSDVAAASRPSDVQRGLVTNISKTAEGNTEIGKQAAALSKDYGERIAEVGRLGAGAQAGALSTGTDIVGSGNAAIASQSASQRMQALSDAQQAALQGTAQQLTAQGQTASAFGTALGGANVQQQQQISGLTSAAEFAQPSPTAFGQTVFNPLTGRFEGGGGDMTQAIGQYAELAAANGITPSQIPNSITGNPILMGQFLEQARRINSSFNPAQWEAAVKAIQTDIAQTGSLGGPLSKAAGSAYQALDSLQAAFNQLGSLQQGGLPFTDMNVPILSSLAQKASLALGPGREVASLYQGALNEARAQVSAVLAPVVGVDAARSASVGLLPDNMTPQEIPQKLQAAKEYINQRVQSFTTPGGTTTQTSAGAGTTKAGGYNFVQDASGNWVPAR